MNRALRDYIIDQNNETLQSVLISLKKKLNSDAIAIDHLHLALYSFQVGFRIFFSRSTSSSIDVGFIYI